MARLCVLALVIFAGTCCLAKPTRIIGGEVATIEQYPSIVQVDNFRQIAGTWSQNCGANILNSVYVLSAAHCFEGVTYNPSQRRIRAGATYRNTGGVTSNVLQSINHPDYRKAGRYDADISVIRLIEPLVYNPAIQQATIINQGYVIPDDQAVVHAGWGTTSAGGSSSSQLRDVTIYTINNELCRTRYLELNGGIVTKNMICAGLLGVGGRDACQGDSGGPLYFQDVVVGIVSWGHGCANETYPGLSTAVSSYTDWIVSTAV